MDTKEATTPASLPPETDDLQHALAATRRRRTNKATKWLAAAVLVAAGFVGGVLVQQQWGTVESEMPAGVSDLSGLLEGMTMPDDTATAAEETTGTIVMVDGTTVYIETDDGATVIVETTEETAVNAVSPIELGELAEGDQVTVKGETDAEGNLSADEVTKTVE